MTTPLILPAVIGFFGCAAHTSSLSCVTPRRSRLRGLPASYAAHEWLQQEGGEPLGGTGLLVGVLHCPIHKALRVTPAIAAGIADRVIPVGEGPEAEVEVGMVMNYSQLGGL